MNWFRCILLIILLFPLAKMAAAGEDPLPVAFEKSYQMYRAKNYKQALTFCTRTIEKKPDQQGACLIITGFVIMDSVSYEESEKYFLQASTALLNSKDAKLLSKIHFGLGTIYFNIARYQESIRQFLLLEKHAIRHQFNSSSRF